MAGRGHATRVEGSVDWFESDATGAGEGALPFRQVADGMWLQPIQNGTGNALTVDVGDGLLQVDTGIARAHAVEMIENVRSVSDGPVGRIVYSHVHTAFNHGAEAWLDQAEERGEPRPTTIGHRNHSSTHMSKNYYQAVAAGHPAR